MKTISTRFITTCLGLLLGVALLHAEPRVGQPAPAFTLKDSNGQSRSLADFAGKYVVLEWTNPDCPFVHKYYDSGSMQALQKEITAQGVVWLSICSSASGKQGNYPPADINKILAERKASPTAYLIDGDGTVGRSYGAKTTPSTAVINPQGLLIYLGAIDSIPSPDPEDIPKAINYVRQALNESMAGKSVSVPAVRSYGCPIHY